MAVGFVTLGINGSSCLHLNINRFSISSHPFLILTLTTLAVCKSQVFLADEEKDKASLGLPSSYFLGPLPGMDTFRMHSIQESQGRPGTASNLS